jgi:hypothetical protein
VFLPQVSNEARSCVQAPINGEGSSLRFVLDQIWQARTPRLQAAMEGIRQRPDIVLEAAAIDLTSYLQIVPTQIVIVEERKIILDTRRSTLEFEMSTAPNPEDIIAYTDLVQSVSLVRPAPILALAPKIQSFGKLLCGLQLCRDHVDSVLYLPGNMREERLHEFSTDSGMDLLQLRFLAAHYAALERAIARRR